MSKYYQPPALSKLFISVTAILLSGCSGGGSSGASAGGSGVVASPWIAPISSGKPQVGASTEIPTSSSGLKTSDLMNVINNGGTLTTKSVALFAPDETIKPQILNNAEIGMTFQADGKFSMKVNEEVFPEASIHDYDLDYVGEYGVFASAGKAADAITQTEAALVFAGIRTDDVNVPTSGNAKYIGNEDSYYQNQHTTTAGETPTPQEFSNYVSASYLAPNGEGYYSLDESYNNGVAVTNGNFVMRLEADFAKATVKGSAEGNVSKACCDNPTTVTLPMEVTFNESSIAQSSFSGSGAVNVDNQNIPINYVGNFFGPGAAEASVIFDGQNESAASVIGFGYLNK